MPMNSTPTNNTQWVQIGTGLTVCVVQPRGDHLVHIASAVPADANLVGFLIKSGEPTELPNVAALGGKVFVRSHVNTTGAVIHASA